MKRLSMNRTGIACALMAVVLPSCKDNAPEPDIVEIPPPSSR